MATGRRAWWAAFAVFGASQVGKSYLVKNLLSVDGAPLAITLGGTAALASLLLLVPAPLHTVAQGVVWLPESAIIRAGTLISSRVRRLG